MASTQIVAGDLTVREIGRTIRVTYKNGNVTSTVEDVLTKVVHSAPQIGAYPTAAQILAARTATTLFFRDTRWTSGALFDAREVGLEVASDLEVTVL